MRLNEKRRIIKIMKKLSNKVQIFVRAPISLNDLIYLNINLHYNIFKKTDITFFINFILSYYKQSIKRYKNSIKEIDISK